MSGPDPTTLFPLAGMNRLCFLKNLVKNPNIMVGNYTYYDDFEDVGNFEKNVKYLFDDATIQKLLEIQWWNWPPEKISQHVADLTGEDVNALLD